MSKPLPKRPGGRSSRIKNAVFDAVEALLGESPGEMPSMAAIAERSQVNPTSLYRRWRDVRTLVAEAAVERLMRDQPVPDTGSLREDLIGWAESVARMISTERDLSLLRTVALSSPGAGEETEMMNMPIGRRIAELHAMLERGRQRGETAPSVGDLIEIVLAPLYLHALFLGPIKEPKGVSRLVDRALKLSQLPD